MKPAATPRTDVPADPTQRIAELEAEVEHLKQEMRAFSYSVSHDLRAPLRAIEGFTRILSEDYAEKLDEEARKFMQHVLDNAQIMSVLIEGLLQYHRLNDKPVSRSSVDMTQLTKEVMTAAPKTGGPEPEVILPTLPSIPGDPVLIRIAWEQLVGNAVKFSKRAAKPAIEFGSDERNGETVVWVKDNGIGFDMQYANKLFQMFQKLQKDPEFDGHGVGLALVRRVAEKHKGRVWADAKVNGGATFFFAVPK